MRQFVSGIMLSYHHLLFLNIILTTCDLPGTDHLLSRYWPCGTGRALPGTERVHGGTGHSD
eukprot:3940393-Rhodomonas_salina.3